MARWLCDALIHGCGPPPAPAGGGPFVCQGASPSKLAKYEATMSSSP